MRNSLMSLAAVLVGLAATSCGGAREAAHSLSQFPPDSDGPHDNPSHPEQDDMGIRDLGREAGVAEAQAIKVLLKRYYLAAAASDGTGACSLTYSVVAASVSEDFGKPPGPPALRGSTCAVVMSKLFKQHHEVLAMDLANLRVTTVRVDGHRALALLSFGPRTERYIPLRRERGVWKIYTVLDLEIP